MYDYIRSLAVIQLIVLANSVCYAGQPEITVTDCENKKLNLHCNPDEQISILSANYGRTDMGTCPHLLMMNQDCRTSNAVHLVAQRCENQTKCSVDASNRIFGDPCPGTYKYLTINYKCQKVQTEPCDSTEVCSDGTCLNIIDICDGKKDCSHGEDELGCDYLTEYQCEDHNMHLRCNRGELISIINANYGRLTDQICQKPKQMRDLSCKGPLSLMEVKERCNRKLQCEIPARNSVFGDPCENTYKYLEVHYECVKVSPCTSHEFQCDNGHCIPMSKKCDGIRDCDEGDDEQKCHYLSEFACENANLHIHCKGNESISILGASYGRHNKQLCEYQEKDKCHATSSLDIVKQKCQGKSQCDIEAKNTVFGDPCRGVVKYLSVNYLCLLPNGGINGIEDIFVRSGFPAK